MKERERENKIKRVSDGEGLKNPQRQLERQKRENRKTRKERKK